MANFLQAQLLSKILHLCGVVAGVELSPREIVPEIKKAPIKSLFMVLLAAHFEFY